KGGTTSPRSLYGWRFFCVPRKKEAKEVLSSCSLKNKINRGANMGKKNKDFVEKITAMEDDFAQWYTDVVKQAELVDYGQVRGTMIIQPYGYAIWANIKDELDRMIKETGHSNVAFP